MEAAVVDLEAAVVAVAALQRRERISLRAHPAPLGAAAVVARRLA